jgi:hypothetical protein
MSNGDDNLYDEEMVPIVFDRPAKPPKPQPPKPPAPPPPPMVDEALALIDPPVEPAPTPEEHEMNELTGLLPVWLRDREVTTPGFAPANIPPPPAPCSDTAAVGETMSGRGNRTTGALGEVIRHCFGNYANWRKIQKSPE